MKRILLFAAGMAITLAAAAQPSEQAQPKDRNDHQPPKDLPSVEQEAQMRVEQMAAELPLTQKQVNKLLNYYEKDIQYRRKNFHMGRGPRPDGGKRPDSNGQQGSGMGHGRPPQGNPGMGTGNGRGPGMGAGAPPSGRPPVAEADLERLEKYNLKQENKLRKIIGDDNYGRWRASHPQDMLELPELK